MGGSLLQVTDRRYEYPFAAWLHLNMKKLFHSCDVSHLWFATDDQGFICRPYQFTSPSWIISFLCCPLTLSISFFTVLPTVPVQDIHSVESLFLFSVTYCTLSVLYSKPSIIFALYLPIVVWAVHKSIILLVSPWKQNRKYFDAVVGSLCESVTWWQKGCNHYSLMECLENSLTGVISSKWVNEYQGLIDWLWMNEINRIIERERLRGLWVVWERAWKGLKERGRESMKRFEGEREREHEKVWKRESMKWTEGETAWKGLKERDHERIEGERARKGLKEIEHEKDWKREHEKDWRRESMKRIERERAWKGLKEREHEVDWRRDSMKRIEGERAWKGLKEIEHEVDWRRDSMKRVEGERAWKGLKEREHEKDWRREHEKDWRRESMKRIERDRDH